MFKGKIKKLALAAGFIFIIFILGFAGGFFFSGMAVGMGDDISEEREVRAYPIYELGEFQLSLPGNEFTDPTMVSFELVLELQNKKVLQRLDSEVYWRALFRNEIISESMSQGQAVFRSPEGLLKLGQDVTTRLNSVGPSFSGVSTPIRRIFLKSFVMQ